MLVKKTVSVCRVFLRTVGNVKNLALIADIKNELQSKTVAHFLLISGISVLHKI